MRLPLLHRLKLLLLLGRPQRRRQERRSLLLLPTRCHCGGGLRCDGTWELAHRKRSTCWPVRLGAMLLAGCCRWPDAACQPRGRCEGKALPGLLLLLLLLLRHLLLPL